MTDYVLIVDDNSSFRYFMQELLNYFGYVTRTAQNGLECLRVVSSIHKPSLILLDNQMPKITGIEVLKVMQDDASAHSSIPVIAIVSDEELEEKFIEYGALAVIIKPFDIIKLNETIQKFFKYN